MERSDSPALRTGNEKLRNSFQGCAMRLVGSKTTHTRALEWAKVREVKMNERSEVRSNLEVESPIEAFCTKEESNMYKKTSFFFSRKKRVTTQKLCNYPRPRSLKELCENKLQYTFFDEVEKAERTDKGILQLGSWGATDMMAKAWTFLSIEPDWLAKQATALSRDDCSWHFSSDLQIWENIEKRQSLHGRTANLVPYVTFDWLVQVHKTLTVI